MSSARRRRWTAAAVALALVLSACGGDDAIDEPAAAPTEREAEPAEPPEEQAEPAEEAEEQAEEPTETAAEPPQDTDGTSDASAGPVTVRFTTADGETLEGAVYGSGDIGIVLAHMRGRDKSTWRPFAEAASAAGYRVLIFDFRGYGVSSGERDTNLDTDLIAAVQFLRSEGITNTVVMGASMGGTATVNVAAQLELSAAVSLSAPGNFQGLQATDVAGDVVEPLLVVAAENDQPYAADAQEIDAAAPASQLQILEGNAHGTNLFAEHDPALTELLLEFVRTRVG